MNKVKSIGLIVLTVLAVMVALQNTETAVTRILFWQITMPRVLLLALVFLVGIAIGIVLGARLGSDKGKTHVE